MNIVSLPAKIVFGTAHATREHAEPMADILTRPGTANEQAGDLAALRAEVADLRARLEGFERILQIRDAALAAAPAPAPSAAIAPPPPAGAPPPARLPAQFEIAADELLPVHDGFYRLEWGPEGAFRWTGPGAEVRFEAWIDRTQPLVATLQLFHFGLPNNAKDLVLEVDGTAHPLARQGNDKILRSEPIAARPGDGPSRLTLKVAHVHSPAARGGTDQRILGVAFQRLRLDRA